MTQAGCLTTADPDVHHKYKNVICALVWHLTKTLNFLSLVHRRRGAPGNPVPRSGTQFIYFCFPLLSLCVEAFERLLKNGEMRCDGTTCLHHRATSRLKDWAEKMLQRALEAFNGPRSQPLSGYIISVFSLLMEELLGREKAPRN